MDMGFGFRNGKRLEIIHGEGRLERSGLLSVHAKLITNYLPSSGANACELQSL